MEEGTGKWDNPISGSIRLTSKEEAFAVNPGYNNGVFPQNMSMQGPYYAGYIAPGQGARWSPPGLEAWPREGPPSGTPNAVVGWPATTNDSYVAVVRGDHLGNTGTVRRRWHSTIKKGKGMPCASPSLPRDAREDAASRIHASIDKVADDSQIRNKVVAYVAEFKRWTAE
ncbi:hypothetical protein BDFG_08418 [Blastomyces dermatitidis ATCC 26199]|nr:hypothetical protein BDFG_08418 [Blastomyces dermatitidis ATCC 26199]